VAPARLPYDVTGDASDDLAYDMVLDKRSPKKILDERVQEMVDSWKNAGFKVTKADKAKARQFLNDNPQLPIDWISQIRFGPGFDSLILGYKPRKGEFDELHFPRKIKSAEGFMKYLPQLMLQSMCSQECETDRSGTKTWRWTIEDLEAPYASVVFSHFEGKPNTKLIDFQMIGDVPVEIIEE
jgi:hypothetical protein